MQGPRKAFCTRVPQTAVQSLPELLVGHSCHTSLYSPKESQGKALPELVLHSHSGHSTLQYLREGLPELVLHSHSGHRAPHSPRESLPELVLKSHSGRRAPHSPRESLPELVLKSHSCHSTLQSLRESQRTSFGKPFLSKCSAISKGKPSQPFSS